MYHLYKKNKNRHEKGKIAEKIARDYLIGKKYIILHKNYRNFFGEIDIIAKQKNALGFIEVKSSSRQFLSAESVTDKKCEKIFNVARLFLHKEKLQYSSIFFEIICVNIKNKQIHHFTREFFDF